MGFVLAVAFDNRRVQVQEVDTSEYFESSGIECNYFDIGFYSLPVDITQRRSHPLV